MWHLLSLLAARALRLRKDATKHHATRRSISARCVRGLKPRCVETNPVVVYVDIGSCAPVCPDRWSVPWAALDHLSFTEAEAESHS